jgi:nucleoside-diphosphate-sugar epimerase
MRIFVAGATGVLGQPVVKLLAEAGHDVRGVARDEGKGRTLTALGATPVQADLFDGDSVRTAVGDAEAVLHLATKIPPLTRMRSAGAWNENNRLRTEATRHLVDAAVAAGAGLFVQESITFIYADGGAQWLSEHSPVVPAWKAALKSTVDMERIAGEFASGDRRGVVLRFGLFYGASSAATRDSIKLMKRRMFPVMGSGENYFSSIHVDDAARAVVYALNAPSGAYNVVEDDPVTQAEYADTCAEVFGLPKPWRAPRWVAGVMIGGPAKYLMQSQRVSNKRFKEATGWAPQYPSVREGFRQVADELARAAQ